MGLHDLHLYLVLFSVALLRELAEHLLFIMPRLYTSIDEISAGPEHWQRAQFFVRFQARTGKLLFSGIYHEMPDLPEEVI
jgi:hypothetical protein